MKWFLAAMLFCGSAAAADSQFESAGEAYGRCVGIGVYPQLQSAATVNCDLLDLASRISESTCEHERMYWLHFIPPDQQPIFLDMAHQLMVNEMAKVVGLKGCVVKHTSY